MTDSTMVSFRPGRGVALVRVPFLVLVDAENARFAERLWALMEDEAGIDELLEELSAAGLRNLGDFALAELEADDSARIVVRGAAVVDVGTAEGSEKVEPEGARTWRELIVENVSHLVLRFDSEATDTWLYRAERGVLPASSLGWFRDGLAPVDLGDAVPELAEVIAPDEIAPALDPSEAPASSVVAEPESASLAPEPGEESAAEDSPAAAAPDEHTIAGSLLEASLAQPDERTVGGVSNTTAPPADPMLTQVPPVGPLVTTAPPDDSAGLISMIPGGAPPQPAVPNGDHDGHTITRAELEAHRARGGAAPPPSPPAASGGGLLGQLCLVGHASSPHASHCRVCGTALSGETAMVTRPPLGVLTFSTGDVVVLTGSAILGRNPKHPEGQVDSTTQLVRLDIGSALSRSHAAVVVDGWQVLVDDLKSGNGTTVTLPGREPRRLLAGEPVLLQDGAVIDLAGEVTATYDAKGQSGG